MTHLYTLSRIILPHANELASLNLYMRTWKDVVKLNNSIRRCIFYSFDTWFNAFPAKKYYFYCNLGDLYLILKIESIYKLIIYGTNYSHAFGLVSNILYEGYQTGYCKIKIDDAREYDSIFFRIIHDENINLNYVDALWATDIPPHIQNKLAIITCTFNRENFIKRNINIFVDFISKNHFLNNDILLFIVDNANNLSQNLSSKYVHIIPNINSGGTGGFTRGIIEVLENYSNYSRMLLMDDDINIEPEVFLKTLTFCNYLKDYYKESFISGAMLDNNSKVTFIEQTGQIIGYNNVTSLHNLNLNDFTNVCAVNNQDLHLIFDEKVKPHSAWWFHCLHIDTIKKNGLPIPFFIRGDDVEWGKRNFGKHFIAISGISVWHDPFSWRVSDIISNYFQVRNLFFVNMLYTQNYYSRFVDDLWQYFKPLLKTWNYISIEIFLEALSDILKGSETLVENPENLLKRISKINHKRHIQDFGSVEVNHALNSLPLASKLKRLLYKLSLWNLLFTFTSTKDVSCCGSDTAPIEFFMLRKKVVVINPLTKKGEIRKLNRKLSINYIIKFFTIVHKIKKNYFQIENDLKIKSDEMKTTRFWKNYLNIK